MVTDLRNGDGPLKGGSAVRRAKKRKNIGLFVVVIILLVVASIRLFTGFIIIQPLGLLTDGATIWYVRSGLDIPFITSPDGYSLERTGSVSLLGTTLSAATLLTAVDGKEIARFPYSELLYNVSTGVRDD